MKLVFERSREGRVQSILPAASTPKRELSASLRRQRKLHLPALSEIDLSRHYTELAKHVHGVNSGFYPLGSCTMKYNPKINEALSALPGFTDIHPLQCAPSSAGCREVISTLEKWLCEITGMDAMNFTPAAGAHGEFTGLLTIKAYHESRGELNTRTKIIVPDSAHGTNPASAKMCGFTVVNIPSAADGCVDLEALKKAVGPDTAGLMLTNPNTVGIFDKNILEITKIVHEAGGLCYYDGANMNAVMGKVRPGDMGFDVIHLNLHKTFSTPHGGGGPGSGPCGAKKFLEPFLRRMQMTAFNGNFLVIVRALAYVKSLGAEGIRAAAEGAVLNANYMKALLEGAYKTAFQGHCMHEFVLTLEALKHDKGVSALDVAKALLDRGIHPPTMYFPLIVHEALMIEPTETESKDTLDEAAQAFLEILKEADSDAESLHASPKRTYIRRPDETRAARQPVLKYSFGN